MNLLFIESSIDPSRGGVQRVSYSLYDYFESHGISCYFAYYLVGYDKIAENKKLFFLRMVIKNICFLFLESLSLRTK